MNIDLWKFEFTHWLGICRLLHAVHKVRDHNVIQITRSEIMGRYRSFRDKLHYNPDYSVMSHFLSHCIEFGLEIMEGLNKKLCA